MKTPNGRNIIDLLSCITGRDENFNISETNITHIEDTQWDSDDQPEIEHIYDATVILRQPIILHIGRNTMYPYLFSPVLSIISYIR